MPISALIPINYFIHISYFGLNRMLVYSDIDKVSLLPSNSYIYETTVAFITLKPKYRASLMEEKVQKIITKYTQRLRILPIGVYETGFRLANCYASPYNDRQC